MERFTRSFRGTQMSQCDHRLSNSNNVKRRGHLFAYKYLQFSIDSGYSVLEIVYSVPKANRTPSQGGIHVCFCLTFSHRLMGKIILISCHSFLLSISTFSCLEQIVNSYVKTLRNPFNIVPWRHYVLSDVKGRVLFVNQVIPFEILW